VLNAFGLPYAVLLEMDGKPEEDPSNQNILDLLDGNRCVRMGHTLEILVGHDGHFRGTYDAMKWFTDPGRITQGCKDMVRSLLGIEPPAA
jgi:hypothetical protein